MKEHTRGRSHNRLHRRRKTCKTKRTTKTRSDTKSTGRLDMIAVILTASFLCEIQWLLIFLISNAMTFWYFKCLNTSYLHSVPRLSCNFTWQGKFWLFLYEQNMQWELPTCAAQIYGLIPVRESVNKRGSVCACMYKSNEKPRLLFHYWEWKHQREGCCVHSRRDVNANWLIYLC